MIYADSSVLLAELLAEDRHPAVDLWQAELAASRIAKYEIWVRLQARGLAHSHGEAAEALLGRLHLLALSDAVLERALDPFPVAVRTLDALHLASLVYLHRQGVRPLQLATYDVRLARAAHALQLELYPLGA